MGCDNYTILSNENWIQNDVENMSSLPNFAGKIHLYKAQYKIIIYSHDIYKQRCTEKN